jgi:hypothetical protein
MKWDKVCHDREVGGLWVRREFNLALENGRVSGGGRNASSQ